MPPIPTSSATQLLEALPQQWHIPALVGVVVVRCLIRAAQFAAAHGGLCGIAKSVLHGKPNS